MSSKTAQTRWVDARDKNIQVLTNLANAPLFSHEAGTALIKGFTRNASDGERAASERMLVDAGNILLDAEHGKLGQNKWAGIHRQKLVDGSLLIDAPAGGGQFTGLTNWYNEMDLDMEWRPVFNRGDFRTNRFASIGILTSLVKWGEVGMNAPIETSPYATAEWDKLIAKRFGGGIGNDRRTMNLNQQFAITLNNEISALRWKSMEFQADFAYILLNAAFAAANTASQVTAFITGDLPRTINKANVALIQRLKGTGQNVSANTQMHLYAALELQDVIEAAFDATKGLDGENIRVRANIVRHYSTNLATDLALGGNDVCALVRPGFENLWADFDGLKFETTSEIKRNTLEVIGQEQYNAEMNSLQCQIIEMV